MGWDWVSGDSSLISLHGWAEEEARVLIGSFLSRSVWQTEDHLPLPVPRCDSFGESHLESEGQAGEDRWSGRGQFSFSLFPIPRTTLADSTFSSKLQLAIDVLLTHPPLLVLTPALLAVFSVASVPFLVVIMRLLLLGYYESP